MAQVTRVTVPVVARVVGASTTYTIDKLPLLGVGGTVPLTSLDSYTRGYIIRGGSTDWEAYSAETDRNILDCESRTQHKKCP